MRVRQASFAWSAPVPPVYANGKNFGGKTPFNPFRLVLGLITLPIWLPFWLLRLLWQMSCGSAPDSEPEAAEGGDIARTVGPPRLVLKGIDLEVEAGSLCVLVGAVGAGKTSLIHALLGEMEHEGGDVDLAGSVAYTAQSAFVMNDTVRNNILFGCEWDEARYSEVVQVCSLKSDLEQLPAGDMTQVGERGITLSGGQKQRVGLARACYSNKDVVILDDPLSAVDAHVGHHIFEHCIGRFLKKKTVIMSCHQLQYVASADQIVLLDGETITENWSGSYADLLAGDLHLSELMREYGASAAESEPATAPAPEPEPEPSPELEQEAAAPVTKSDVQQKKDGKTMTTEERETGRVKLEVYASYATIFGGCAFLMVFVWFMAGQLAQVVTDWWMGRWSSSGEDPTVNEKWVVGFTRRCDEHEEPEANDCWSRNSLLYYYIVCVALPRLPLPLLQCPHTDP